MPKVIIENMGSKAIDCLDKTERVLDILLKEIDWMHACGGKGRCTTCKAEIVEGMDNLTENTQAELNYLSKGQIGPKDRLTCQVKLNGNVVIRTPDNYKLPHMKYTE
ncbi:MAG: (2Fe-2S)-binding protein [Cyclobacteriaceae bacterium]